MQIKIREIGDVSIVELTGSLDTGTSATTEAILFKLLDSGKKKILLNTAATTYISSPGLRIVLATSKKLQQVGGKIRICQPTPQVMEVLTITGFTTIVEIFETEEEALSGF
jgi:anti-anti-sigma factor